MRHKKKRRAERGVLSEQLVLLLRDRATEHPVDLLVGGVAAGLRSLCGGQRLVSSALGTARGRRSGLSGGIGSISRALDGGEVSGETAYLLFEIVDIGLQRLEVLAAGQHGERCNGSNLDNRTLHNDKSPYWWLSKSASPSTRIECDLSEGRRLLGGRNCNKSARCLQLKFISCRSAATSSELSPIRAANSL